jgi:hypothetical protein
VSQAIKDRISEKNTGKVRSAEHKANLSASLKKGFENGRVQNSTKGYKHSEESKANMSKAQMGRTHSQKTKDKIGDAHRGKTISQEAIKKQKSSWRETFEKNGGAGVNKGHKHTDEFKARLSEFAKNRSPEQKMTNAQAMIKARTGWKASPEQKENYRVARLKYMRDNPDNIGIVWRDTKPELEFEQALINHGLVYQKQFHTANPHYLYDFKVSDTLVEIDGPYHWNPAMFKTQELFEMQVERDAAKNLAAVRLGLKIVRIPVISRLPDDWKDWLVLQGCILFQ